MAQHIGAQGSLDHLRKNLDLTNGSSVSFIRRAIPMLRRFFRAIGCKPLANPLSVREA
ncbi:hypothetical protein [Terriglobus saanensis]|uniref:hypothetical protein n=1 Tax=Terriglobus saanensis TaxID=870903 RepID=UPI0002E8A3C6|nr:hypothetical protein [Terriglobus saanensis]